MSRTSRIPTQRGRDPAARDGCCGRARCRAGLIALLGIAALGIAACKPAEVDVSDPGVVGESCQPDAAASEEGACAEGLACEPTADPDASICASPIVVRGDVFDAETDAAIAGAHVMAMDASGAPVSSVAITDADGHYELSVTIPRDDEGEPLAEAVLTMSAAAPTYAQFPGGIRPPLPVDVSGSVEDGVIENPTTRIGLIALDAADVGVTVSGRIDADAARGAMVVADGGTWARYGLADAEGSFSVFDVLDGAVTVRAYRRDLDVTAASIQVAGEHVDDVVLAGGDEGTSRISGMVSIVNSTFKDTSVVLIPEALFDAQLERGPIPWGLRAPGPGIAPNITGGFEITGVPAGRYKVLAAFENDGIVRDPDTSIAGTDIVEIEVVGGEDMTLSEGFKCTQALAVVFPGATSVEVVGATPTFSFENDSSEDGYELVVYDALGNLVWSRDDIPTSPGSGTSSAVEVPYEGPALEPGMIYQFRAGSFRDTNDGRVFISRTEDLRGAFQVE